MDGAKDNLKTFTLLNPIECGKYHRLFIQKSDSLLIMQLDDMMPYQEQIFHRSFIIQNNVVLGKITSLPQFSNK